MKAIQARYKAEEAGDMEEVEWLSERIVSLREERDSVWMV